MAMESQNHNKPEMDVHPPAKVVEWVGDAARGHLRLLDQRALPETETYMDCGDAQMVWEAIKHLAVRSTGHRRGGGLWNGPGGAVPV